MENILLKKFLSCLPQMEQFSKLCVKILLNKMFVAERKHRPIVETVRPLLLSTFVPSKDKNSGNYEDVNNLILKKYRKYRGNFDTKYQ